jgi:hypothetical protein
VPVGDTHFTAEVRPDGTAQTGTNVRSLAAATTPKRGRSFWAAGHRASRERKPVQCAGSRAVI